MAALFEDKKVKRQTGVQVVQKKKGIFSSETIDVEEPIYEEVVERVPTGKYSDKYIDIDDFAKRITEACNSLHQDGYDVINITDVIEGRYNYEYQANGHRMDNHCSGGGFGYGYGYSLTDGVVIIGKKRD